MTRLEKPLAEDVLARKLHVYLEDLHEWAPEYAEARRQVLDAAGVDPAEKHYADQTVIRIFSPDVPVGLHADGETQIDCGVGAGGRNTWHVSPPSGCRSRRTRRSSTAGTSSPGASCRSSRPTICIRATASRRRPAGRTGSSTRGRMRP